MFLAQFFYHVLLFLVDFMNSSFGDYLNLKLSGGAKFFLVSLNVLELSKASLILPDREVNLCHKGSKDEVVIIFIGLN